MNDIVEGWQEMEGKDKVECMVDKACENGRLRKEVERLYRKQRIGSKTLMTFFVLIIVLYGVKILVFILLHMNTMCT